MIFRKRDSSTSSSDSVGRNDKGNVRVVALFTAISALLLPRIASAQTLFGYLKPEVASRIQNGNPTLDDIVATGAAFAQLLSALSGAIFFGTFIYGGAMYLMSFGRKDWVKKGTDAMTGGAIGMVIVMGAWTIVKYFAGSLLPK